MFSHVVGTQLCAAFPLLERISAAPCHPSETAPAGCSPVRPRDANQDTVTTQVSWKSAFLTPCQRKWALLAISCAQPSSVPIPVQTQHVCRTINSSCLTLGTKWTGSEQLSSSNEGQGTALPHSLCETDVILLPSQQNLWMIFVTRGISAVQQGWNPKAQHTNAAWWQRRHLLVRPGQVRWCDQGHTDSQWMLSMLQSPLSNTGKLEMHSEMETEKTESALPGNLGLTGVTQICRTD